MWMKIFAALAALLAAGCTQQAEQTEKQQAAEALNEPAIAEPELEKIADGVWIHKSWNVIEPWGLVLSQGLVVKTDAAIVLVDTAWTNEETAKLLELVREEAGGKTSIAIVTHAHSDKMGGMGELNAAKIPVYMHKWTKEDAPARGLEISDQPDAETLFPDRRYPGVTINLDRAIEVRPSAGNEQPRVDDGLQEGRNEVHSEILAYYPGAGHTRDNIVVYYAPAKVLFGGCLIRPGDAKDLGNTADGDVGHWAEAVRNIAQTFPDAEIVIPSHGPKGGRELLDHTIELAEAEAAKP